VCVCVCVYVCVCVRVCVCLGVWFGTVRPGVTDTVVFAVFWALFFTYPSPYITVERGLVGD